MCISSRKKDFRVGMGEDLLINNYKNFLRMGKILVSGNRKVFSVICI